MRHFLTTSFVITAFLLGLAWVNDAEAQSSIPINIESVPAGAAVFLDSPDAPTLGVTPLRNVRVTRGTHTLIFRLNNYEEARLTVTVARRRETFRAVLRALGILEVSAGNEAAEGGQVQIDGRPAGVGTLGRSAVRIENLTPGRHQVEVTREGHRPFSQWVDIQGGQVVRIPVLLERSAPRTGSVLVSSDVVGASVFIDGQARGVTPTVIEDVPAGTHTVEIRSEGLAPFSQTILIEAGQRATVAGTLRGSTTTGSIAVITDVPGARVRINGVELPVGSYTRDNLAPGNYVVQVMAEGHAALRREVTVTAGQTTSIDVQLEREVGPAGRINIVVSAPGATVTVNGEEHPSPYVNNTPTAGTHAVVVRAPGYEESSFTCSTVPGTPSEASCDRRIDLGAETVRISVSLEETLRVPASVLIDGEEVGRVPFDGRIPMGGHSVEIQADGYETFRREVDVRPGEGDVVVTTRLVDAAAQAAASAGTHTAIPIPMNHPMLDISVGWPYLAELRLSIGLHELVDAGFAIRTMGRLTEFEGRARVGVRVARQLGFGGQVRFGGGLGPPVGGAAPCYAPIDGITMTDLQRTAPYDGCSAGRGGLPAAYPASAMRSTSPRAMAQDEVPTQGSSIRGLDVNSFFLSIEGQASLLLEPAAAVTLWLGLDLTTDQYGAQARNSGTYADWGPSADTTGSDQICTETPEGLSCRRQDMARLRFGGAVEFVLNREWNGWLIFEGVLLQGEDHRRVYSGFIFDAPDIRIYPRFGFTYKF